jgi:YhcH/YjgK/YiaL family protein
MIYAHITTWRSIPGISTHPAFITAFEWIEANAATAADGFHQLGQEGFYVRVMGYGLKNREEAKYENHRNTIDLQFTIEGAEGIEIAPIGNLTPKNNYSEEKDVEHFETPAPAQRNGTIFNLKNYFTILVPGEPHMPQLKVDGYSEVKKLVVKIPAALL